MSDDDLADKLLQRWGEQSKELAEAIRDSATRNERAIADLRTDMRQLGVVLIIGLVALGGVNILVNAFGGEFRFASAEAAEVAPP